MPLLVPLANRQRHAMPIPWHFLKVPHLDLAAVLQVSLSVKRGPFCRPGALWISALKKPAAAYCVWNLAQRNDNDCEASVKHSSYFGICASVLVSPGGLPGGREHPGQGCPGAGG